MTAHDDIPDEVKRMRTSELVATVARGIPRTNNERIGARSRADQIEMRERAIRRLYHCAAELDARIPVRC